MATQTKMAKYTEAQLAARQIFIESIVGGKNFQDLGPLAHQIILALQASLTLKPLKLIPKLSIKMHILNTLKHCANRHRTSLL